MYVSKIQTEILCNSQSIYEHFLIFFGKRKKKQINTFPAKNISVKNVTTFMDL